MDKENIIRLFTAIGDPVRLEILFLLGEHDHLNVGEITRKFRLSQPAISHHLRVLREADVVRSEKMGQEVYYRLDCESVVSRLQSVAGMVNICHRLEKTEP